MAAKKIPRDAKLRCGEPSGCATGEPGCTSRGTSSAVQKRAWVSIERVVIPPKGSVIQT